MANAGIRLKVEKKNKRLALLMTVETSIVGTKGDKLRSTSPMMTALSSLGNRVRCDEENALSNT